MIIIIAIFTSVEKDMMDMLISLTPSKYGNQLYPKIEVIKEKHKHSATGDVLYCLEKYGQYYTVLEYFDVLLLNFLFLG